MSPPRMETDLNRSSRPAEKDDSVVDLFVRSYYKDFRWLRYCLASIEKFCRGFRRVVLVVPQSSVERLRFSGLTGFEAVACRDYADDYLGQQVTKVYADTLTDADYICHVDSDCVFRRRVQPKDLLEDGKVRIMITPQRYVPARAPWRRVTERFLRCEVAFDFMRRQPLTFPRWLYPALRTRGESLHGVTLEEYILSQPARGFSEFNALGAFAHRHHHDAISWELNESPDYDESYCRWFWSWGGITDGVRREIESILE
jgi:hypothetical protein